MANQDNEAALIGLRTELLEIQEAEAALANKAITDYFEQARAQALDAMLNPSLDADENTLWRIRAVAQTVDGLFKYLNEKRDMRAFVEERIQANSEEST